tara:strand:+ start:85 stop:558 length:474 start_codon:yes stop_codon:yes gene_type:complete
MQRLPNSNNKRKDTDPPDLTGKLSAPSKEDIESALHDEVKFHLLIDCFKTFHACLQMHKEDLALCESVTHFIITHPEQFKQIITSSSNVGFIGERVSPKLGLELIDNILSKDDEFDRVIKSTYDLRLLNKAFPQHTSIFSSESVEGAREEARKSRKP